MAGRMETGDGLRGYGIGCIAVDAAGAGDAFDAAFLGELSRGAGVADAARHANVAATLSAQGFGAVAPIPLRENVNRFLAGTSGL